MNIKLNASNKVSGNVVVPGDKSISHRAIMLASLSSGTTKITNFLPSQDCLSTMACFQKMGISITRHGKTVEVIGNGLKGLKEPTSVLDCGNSGTTMRVLSGILAGQKFYSVLTGDESLSRRPMTRVIKPLSRMGAEIWARKGDLAPLSIRGLALKGTTYKLEIASAQVKTALMFAGLFASGKTTVVEPVPTRDHTERMMPSFGIPVTTKNGRIMVQAPKKLGPCDVTVPGDISSAVFFISLGLLAKKGHLIVRNVGVNPTRTGALKVLTKMGARLELVNKKNIAGEPVADIIAHPSELQNVKVAGKIIPSLIDELPLLAMLMTQAEGTSVIRNAEELRVKESDRISLMVKNLESMGAKVEERPDGMIIEGRTKLKGASIETAGDHRIAMTFAVAASIAKGTTEIVDADCASVSFPGFFKQLEAVRS